MLQVVFVLKPVEEQMEIVQRFGSIRSNDVRIERIEGSIVTLVPTSQKPFFGENFASFHVERGLQTNGRARRTGESNLPNIFRRDSREKRRASLDHCNPFEPIRRDNERSR